MTMKLIDKDTLVDGINRLKSDALQKKSQCKKNGLDKIMYQIGAYNKVISLIDTIEVKEVQEEPVSKELEEAAYCFSRKDSKEISEPAKFYCVVEDKARIFKAGAKWQKQQIMAKAIDGEVGYWNLRGLSVNVDLPLSADEGDKVKVILIEED